MLALDPKQSRLFSESLTCISCLIPQTIYPRSALTQTIQALHSNLREAAFLPENALRIIQISMEIILNYPSVTRENLNLCFSICITFIRQQPVKSKNYSFDVLNAASVTLRQLAMTTVTKLRTNSEQSTALVAVHVFGSKEPLEMGTFAPICTR